MTITDLLDELGVEYRRAGEHHHVREGWIGFDCVQCSPGWGKFRCGYNLAYGHCSCWECGKMSTYSVLQALGAGRLGPIGTRIKGLAKETATYAPEIRGKLTVPDGVKDLKPAHIKYLKHRGFNPEEIVSKWKVQGIGHATRMAWRLFIPVHLGEEVVSWTTRAISDKIKLRYISAEPGEEKVSLKNLVYGVQHCRNAIVVVEGPTDVWKIGYGAGCTFGLAYKKAQLRKIARFPVRGVWFDNEPGAQAKATRLVNDLSAFPGKTFLIQSDAKDPGSASDKEVKSVRKKILGG